ncbi:MAG: hypothetical protein AB8I08_18430 [Sandaracinaceae bacterium]
METWIPVISAGLLAAVGLRFAAMRAETRARLTLDEEGQPAERSPRRAIGVLIAFVFAAALCVGLLPSSEPGWGISGGLAILACTWPAASAVAHPARTWMAGLPIVLVGVGLALGWLDPLWRLSFFSIAAFLPLLFVLIAVVSPSVARKTPGIGPNLSERS